jgi:hypothetical protein
MPVPTPVVSVIASAFSKTALWMFVTVFNSDVIHLSCSSTFWRQTILLYFFWIPSSLWRYLEF